MITLEQAQSLAAKTGGMDETEASQFLELLMSATLSESDGAALLVQLAERGETGSEVAAFVKGLRQHAVACDFHTSCLDVCGTGGSGLTRFNISTTVAFICAAAGIPVAKHGNRGSRRPNGSFDLLDALGIRFELNGEQLAATLKATKVCFLFARTMHPAVGKVVPYRKAAGRRTIFNLAGPLANPATISHQIIGTTNQDTATVLAEALQQLSVERACVVWGAPGIDEFSVTGPSDYFLIENSAISQHRVEQALHPNLKHEDIPGGDAEENAETFHALLNGEEQGPLRDMVLLNAAAAIDIWHNRPVAADTGFEQAASLLDSGAVRTCFEQHRDFVQTL